MAEQTPGRGAVEVHYQASHHDPVYDRLHETAEFKELRRRYRGFAFQPQAMQERCVRR